jgi:lysophospholipase L1-like esterase
MAGRFAAKDLPSSAGEKGCSAAEGPVKQHRILNPNHERTVMRKIWTSIAALVVLAGAGQPFAAEPKDQFFFKKGDRIVFLGDSITEQYQYSTYIELYLTTRFPNWKLAFLNAGIGGDTATGGANRFKEHVLAEKPTAITINFGMNDGGYGQFHKNLNEQYVKNTRAMLDAAKEAKIRVALLSPNSVDPRVNRGLLLYQDTQKKFYGPLKELAAKGGARFVDQYAITRAVLEKRDKDSADKVRPFGDSVHTSPSGGLLMAHTILTGLKAPALVSQVDIDATNTKAVTKACKVENLKKENHHLTFDRTDQALPLPVQKDWLSILPYIKDLKDLNWYGLKVTGLGAGKYQLLIDGKDVASYTADELAKGVNLGNLTTGPLYEQGKKVLDAINAKNAIVHQRFRGVVMFQAPDWLADVAAERKPKELAKRMEKINDKQKEIYKLAQPVTHQFELKPEK